MFACPWTYFWNNFGEHARLFDDCYVYVRDGLGDPRLDETLQSRGQEW